MRYKANHIFRLPAICYLHRRKMSLTEFKLLLVAAVARTGNDHATLQHVGIKESGKLKSMNVVYPSVTSLSY
jgi:hypothetical protein